MESEQTALVVAILILGLPILLLVLLIRTRRRAARAEREREKLQARFAPVLNIEDETAKAVVERDAILQNLADLRKSFAEKREIYDRLRSEVAIFDEKIAFAELGVYEPHFDFGDSETFKNTISEVREKQKDMVKAKTAVTCGTQWTVEGSVSKGRTMTDRQIRLTLRAFNNECDAAIANARWNNVNAMEKRIQNAATQIEKLNASSSVIIEEAYLSLKLKELFLTHEYREALKRERDERAEAVRLAREEQKVIKQAEAAEEEEEKYRQMLEKARAAAAGKTGQDVDRMQERIAALEASLAEAHELSERAHSMAEMTRSGYVYIISNIGSFGEQVVKIGLTRRLDPDDRVRELGDASVPFSFDTHAIIYSDDAPALESALHAEFNDRRVNAANLRKEFFRVQIDEVERAVQRLAPAASFFKDREAQDYHETIARRRVEAEKVLKEGEGNLPLSI